MVGLISKAGFLPGLEETLHLNDYLHRIFSTVFHQPNIAFCN